MSISLQQCGRGSVIRTYVLLGVRSYKTTIHVLAAAAYGDFHTGEEPLNHVTGSWDPLAGVGVWH